MITDLQALILGVIEGFTEYLPISSTAHLILASDILKIAQTNFTKTFEIAIQSGAILAVVALYWRKFLEWDSLKKIIVAFIPTGILGLVFYELVKTHLIGNTQVVLWSLAVGGALLILFETAFKEKDTAEEVENITYKQALAIGSFQSVAMIPGISRSAATIIGGMLMGIGRKAIVEFSFLLAVPTMLAATGLDLVKNYGEFSGSQFNILAIGFIASFVTAVISIKFLLNYVRNHNFTAFGVYRLALVFIFILLAIC